MSVYIRKYRSVGILCLMLACLLAISVSASNTTRAQSLGTDCTSPDNLLVNGCFELPGTGSFIAIENVPGWDGTSGCPTGALLEFQGTLLSSSVPTVQGDQYIEFHGICNGAPSLFAPITISQTIPTIPGNRYALRFQYIAHPDIPGSSMPSQMQRLEITRDVTNPLPIGDPVYQENLFTAEAPDDWTVETVEFIAVEENTRLNFQDSGMADTIGLLFDDVSVVDLGASCVNDPDNLIENGCFELPPLQTNIFEYLPEELIPGWTLNQWAGSACPFTLLEIQSAQPPITAFEGEQFAEFMTGCADPFQASLQNTAIFQTIDVIPGHRYGISFAYAGTPDATEMGFWWGLDQLFSEVPQVNTWQVAEIEQIATTDSITVALGEIRDASAFTVTGAVVDDVRIVDLGPVAGNLTVNYNVQIAGMDTSVSRSEAINVEFCINGFSFDGETCETITDMSGEIVYEDLIAIDPYTITPTNPGGLWVVRGFEVVNLTEGGNVEVYLDYIYFPPEPEAAQTCISLADVFANNGNFDVNGQFLNGLVRVDVSNGPLIVVESGDQPLAYHSLPGGNNYSASGYVMWDFSRKHDYEFTFASNIVVSEFSLRVYDFGDMNPQNTTLWSVELNSNNASASDGISYMLDEYLTLEGDAYNAILGQPGNRRYAISGTDLMSAELNFGHNGNSQTLFTSPDTHIGIDELCMTYTMRTGDLEVTKLVDWRGTDVNLAVEFEICVTGPSYPSGDCFRYGAEGGTNVWEDVLPGEYTVLETLPGVDWNVTQPINPITVPAGGVAEVYVTNELALGSIHATKNVNWNGATPDSASFLFCINSDLLGNTPDCQGVGEGGTAVWDGLVPGVYSVYEQDPGANWSASGGGNVTVVAGQIAFTSITNTYSPPPPPPSCVHDLRADLSGFLINGATGGTITNNGTETCTYPVGLASYYMYDDNIDTQVIFSSTTASVTLAPGQSVDIGPIPLPACMAQVDLFYGDLISPQFNGNRYGPRLLAATFVNGGNYCTP